jgi:acyl carrier protein
MSRDTSPVNRKLNEMGVDSLLVLELSLGIKERIGVTFSAMEFLKGPSVRQLAETADARIWNN